MPEKLFALLIKSMVHRNPRFDGRGNKKSLRCHPAQLHNTYISVIDPQGSRKKGCICECCRETGLCLVPAFVVVQVNADAQHFTFTTIDRAGAAWTELNGVNRYTNGIRSLSTVVGTYQDINGTHGFALNGNVMTPVPIPSGGKDTEALGINNKGEIVGSYGDVSE
jgi:hypothetical protein